MNLEILGYILGYNHKNLQWHNVYTVFFNMPRKVDCWSCDQCIGIKSWSFTARLQLTVCWTLFEEEEQSKSRVSTLLSELAVLLPGAGVCMLLHKAMGTPNPLCLKYGPPLDHLNIHL